MRFVNRESILKGVNKTIRDSRVPFNMLRSMYNYRLPDGRAERRKGFTAFNSNQIHGSQLTKATASVVEGEVNESGLKRPGIGKTPFSYALLKYHDDFQPKTTRDWTVEFNYTVGEPEGYSNLAYARYSRPIYGGGGATPLTLRDTQGTCILDQAVLANHCSINHGTTEAINPTVADGAGEFRQDTFSLSALTVYARTDLIGVYSTIIDTGVYFSNKVNLNYTHSKAPGESLHIAITFDTNAGANGELQLFIDAQKVSSYAFGANDKFAGEEEAINGNTSIVERDIVLLNEHSVRASYSSTCKGYIDVAIPNPGAHNYNYHNPGYETDVLSGARPAPVVNSPPRGTGISEFKIWHEIRAPNQLAANAVIGNETNLKGYWKLDDGGGVCVDSSTNARDITVHGKEPSYIEDIDLITNKGLKFADNQYLAVEYDTYYDQYIEDSYPYLKRCFEDDSNALRTVELQSRNDYTVQMRIRVPYNFQQELNTRNGDPTLTSTEGDTRQKPRFHNYCLFSYNNLGVPTRISDEAGVNTITDLRFNRAYDATLWSVEAQLKPDTTAGLEGVSNFYDRSRFRLAYGSITPTGHIAFTNYLSTVTDQREFRCISSNALTAGEAVTLTFKKETVYYWDEAAGQTTPHGVKFTIYVNDKIEKELTIQTGIVLGGTPPVADLTITPTSLTSAFAEHGGIREILVGASYINHGYDHGIRIPGSDPAVAPTAPDNFPVSQMHMSPYHDQPGFFDMGFFRLWVSALDDEDVKTTLFRKLPQPHEWTSLILNFEIDDIYGTYIPNRSKFSKLGRLGFKGWGTSFPEGLNPGNEEKYKGMYLMQDCLGYGPKPSTFRNSLETTEGNFHGITAFSSTLSQGYGLLLVNDDTVYYDVNAEGNLKSQNIPVLGLLSNYESGKRWFGTNIGDRTVLTSHGGTPKVFNGNVLTQAGFGPWTGGQIEVETIASTGTLTLDNWYGVRILYVSEKTGLYEVSPQFAVQTQTTGTLDTIRIKNIPPHPDPRVTSIWLAMSAPVPDGVGAKDTALAVSVFPISGGVGILPNEFIGSVNIAKLDLTATAVITSDTTVPYSAYSASAFSRLFLAGDKLVPDIIYYSDAGQPERFDRLNNRIVLEEGSGDAIIGLVALFGSLYALKPNSIWRIDQDSSGGFFPSRVTPIGPANDSAYEIAVLPDSGRTVIAFWSTQGPYIFDGVNLEYVGYTIETEDPYSYVDSSKVFTVHDAKLREILFCYPSIENGVTSAFTNEAIVLNYRTQTLYSYNGIVGSIGFSSNINKSLLSGVSTGIYQNEYLALLGSDNGYVYRWNSGDYDGLLNAENTGHKFNIVSVSGSILNFNSTQTVLPAKDEFKGLWITVYDTKTLKHSIHKVQTNTSTSLTIYGTFEFPLSLNDICYVGLTPAELEFPWDVLDRPYFDKVLHELTLWSQGDLSYRFNFNWDTADSRPWQSVANTETERRRLTFLPRSCEAVKLLIRSFDVTSRLNNFLYRVQDAREGKV